MHPVRAVHRCLQRHHGQDRPPQGPDRLRHDRQSGGRRYRQDGAAQADPRADHPVCGGDEHRGPRHARRAQLAHDAGSQRSPRPQSAVRAVVRRLGAERLCRQGSQQAARAPHLPARSPRAGSGAHLDPRR